MRNSDSKQEDFSVWVLISTVRDLMWKVRQKELRKYGLSVRHSGILQAIQRIGDRATPAEVARRVPLEPHSVSEHLTRMERAGLVKRVKDLKRRNMVRLVLTEKGLEAHRYSMRRESILKLMSCISKEERRQLKSSLQKLHEKALEKLRKNLEI